MFFETPANINFAGYADGNTLYAYSASTENLQGTLEKNFHWFLANHLVANAGKCDLLTSSKTPIDTHIFNTEILNKEKVAWNKS